MLLDPQFLEDVNRRSCQSHSEASHADWEGHYKSDVPRLIAEIRQTQMVQKYSEIKERSGKLSNISPLPNVTSDTMNGYIVAFRHPIEVTRVFAAFTLLLSQAVECLRYDETMAHTTLAVCGEISTPFRQDARFQPNPGIVGKLRRAAAELTAEVWQQVVIDFQNWLLTADSVIAAGYPITDHFWRAAAQLWCAGAREGLTLKRPWAAHMTAARFTKNEQPEVVERVRRLVDASPGLGKSQPVEIVVGWYQCNRNGFEIHPEEL